MSEERHIDTNELLDHLCWKFAWEGDRFYPPRETARECVRARYEEDKTHFGEELEREVGQHGRAWDTAVDFFETLQAEGYDPVMRARRYVERDDILTEESLPEDWEWLEESRYRGEVS